LTRSANAPALRSPRRPLRLAYAQRAPAFRAKARNPERARYSFAA